jgi:hypothetical protein
VVGSVATDNGSDRIRLAKLDFVFVIYLTKHSELATFFQTYPDIKDAIEENPGNFAAIPPRPGLSERCHRVMKNRRIKEFSEGGDALSVGKRLEPHHDRHR